MTLHHTCPKHMVFIMDMPASHDDLREVDLNLLVAFEALLAERNVTRAAQRLGMTQSGTSRALARLRETFDDALFVGSARGLVPTPRAESLRQPLTLALGRVREMLRAPEFDSKTAEGAIRLGIPDHLAFLIAPALLQRMSTQAPQMNLVARSFSENWHREVREGVVDLAFGVLSGNEAELRARTCLKDPWVVILRQGHPALQKRWTKKSFAALDHAMMTVTGEGPGHVDRALAKYGLERRVAYRASSPVVVALAATESDLVVTTTALLARRLAAVFPLRVLKLPLPVAPLELPIVWHERNQHDPRHRWIRQTVVDAARAIQ